MENNVALCEGETKSNGSSSEMAAVQDINLVTPPKKFGSVPSSVESSPRRSPRVPKPKLYFGGSESPKTAPTTPQTPKSKTTSTPMRSEEYDCDAASTPNLEPISSNDSFVVPTSIYKVLQASPRKTPKKPPKVDKTGLSPYKSHRPKYLPKNTKLVKKKRLERNVILQNIEKFEAQLVTLPSTIAASKNTVDPMSYGGDNMGTQTALFIIFNPSNFFTIFTEQTFDNHFNTNITDTANFIKKNPHLAKKDDLRALILFLSVSSDQTFFDVMSSIVEDYLLLGKFVLDWEDLKMILMNFGLTTDFFICESVSCYSDVKDSPKTFHFQFFFKVVEHSFPSYSKCRLMRLVKFLSDCLFDPMMQPIVHEVVLLLRRVLKHTLQFGVVEDFILPLNHSHYCWVCNRVIIYNLASDLDLNPLAQALTYRTLYAMFQIDRFDGANTLSRLGELLDDVDGIRKKTTVEEVNLFIAICENLVATSAPSPFNSETKTFLVKLVDFAENISLRYSYFDNLYFRDTVARLRILSSIKHL